MIEHNARVGINPRGTDGGVNYMNRFINLSSAANRSFVWTHFWIPIVGMLILAGVPWITTTPRFSLRTLLIAVTVVAVALGIVTVMIRGYH